MIEPAWIMAGGFILTLAVNLGTQLGMHRSNTASIKALTDSVADMKLEMAKMAPQDRAMVARIDALEYESVRMREKVISVAEKLAVIEARTK